MLISKKLKQTSVANYILYMWHQEDIIRALQLDMAKVEANVISRYECDDNTKAEIKAWYENLIAMMRNENKEQGGHLDFLNAEIESLNSFHNQLLQTPDQMQYNAQFFKILPALKEFRAKNQSGAEVNDIELCLTAIYEVSLMKMSGKDVTAETGNAVKSFAEFLNILSAKYAED